MSRGLWGLSPIKPLFLHHSSHITPTHTSFYPQLPPSLILFYPHYHPYSYIVLTFITRHYPFSLNRFTSHYHPYNYIVLTIIIPHYPSTFTAFYALLLRHFTPITPLLLLRFTPQNYLLKLYHFTPQNYSPLPLLLNLIPPNDVRGELTKNSRDYPPNLTSFLG